jgi:predicted nucleic acid-binding protein
MIGYVDTSAFVAIIVDEPATRAAREFWLDADDVVSSRLIVAETAATLAVARRGGRLAREEYAKAKRVAGALLAELEFVEPDEGVVGRAAELAHASVLRGYDAVHCASAESIDDQDLVAATGDRQLLAAWASLGIVTFDPFELG